MISSRQVLMVVASSRLSDSAGVQLKQQGIENGAVWALYCCQPDSRMGRVCPPGIPDCPV